LAVEAETHQRRIELGQFLTGNCIHGESFDPVIS
jgi:hypothetical protein